MRGKARTLQRNISFSLSDVEGIEAIADAQGVSFAEIVRRAITEYLSTQTKE
ncbi:MAG: hypothetical protein CLLPBCKN_003358 [Chroococcidiopsis cubana SAG 39.79]|uniref:ribbon-helix-helix protein, CopG family n=1 Tax=Chroococcidiopsis cubana TaxID=171392 RepID=UPI000D082BDF|nr:hypothetical protein [Chroococcidiopsis cubana SAG 39.79]PSB59676.1 hypothetical protein C7B79_28600 [Chroococcidiopsis cubana CCALA 043]